MKSTPYYDVENSALLFSSIGHIAWALMMYSGQSTGEVLDTACRNALCFQYCSGKTPILFWIQCFRMLQAVLMKKRISGIFMQWLLWILQMNLPKLQDCQTWRRNGGWSGDRTHYTEEFKRPVENNPEHTNCCCGSFNFDIKPGEYEVYISHDDIIQIQ